MEDNVGMVGDRGGRGGAGTGGCRAAVAATAAFGLPRPAPEASRADLDADWGDAAPGAGGPPRLPGAGVLAQRTWWRRTTRSPIWSREATAPPCSSRHRTSISWPSPGRGSRGSSSGPAAAARCPTSWPWRRRASAWARCTTGRPRRPGRSHVPARVTQLMAFEIVPGLLFLQRSQGAPTDRRSARSSSRRSGRSWPWWRWRTCPRAGKTPPQTESSRGRGALRCGVVAGPLLVALMYACGADFLLLCEGGQCPDKGAAGLQFRSRWWSSR